MSDFKCEVVKIDEVIRHPNADKLIICKIKGYNCISSDLEDGTPRYKAGDYVVYIPEASLVPEWLLQKMGFWKDGKGMLSGANGNRVKIVKLRGEYSQGLMYGVNVNDRGDMVVENETTVCTIREGDDAAETLAITKYEPVIPQHMQGQVGNLLGYTKSYDIESLQNFPNTFQDGEEVVVTEKLHGTLCQVGFIRDLPEDKRENTYDCGNNVFAYVTSKGLAKSGLVQKQVEGNKDNLYVRMFQKSFVETGLAKRIADTEFGSFAKTIYIFGEIMGPGIQSGYSYNKKAPELRIFDVYSDYTYLDDISLEIFLDSTKLTRVPVLYKGPFSMAKMFELRDGKTVEGNATHIREGIVIRAAIEENLNIRGLHDGRKQVKFVSPAYKMTEDDDAIS